MKEFVSLREFKLKGIRCVSVRNLDEELLGFYVGTDEDWDDGIITKKDLKSLDQLKRDINLNTLG
jgi:hypothetical protein